MLLEPGKSIFIGFYSIIYTSIKKKSFHGELVMALGEQMIASKTQKPTEVALKTVLYIRVDQSFHVGRGMYC